MDLQGLTNKCMRILLAAISVAVRNTWITMRISLYSMARRMFRNVERRRKKAEMHRRALVVPGPNYSWSIDAYCKLGNWDIQVYACVDTYSRCVMWIYVDITSCIAVSVLAQYIDEIKQPLLCPCSRDDCYPIWHLASC